MNSHYHITVQHKELVQWKSLYCTVMVYEFSLPHNCPAQGVGSMEASVLYCNGV